MEGFPTNGEKLLSAFPIHPPRPLDFPEDSCKAESLLRKPQSLSQQISGVLQGDTLLAAELNSAQMYPVKHPSSYQCLGIRSYVLLWQQLWYSQRLGTPSAVPLSFSAQCCCERVSVFPQVLCSGSGYEQECPFCPYTWGAVMITASLPEAA